VTGGGRTCWLCHRPFGTLQQWHHPVPKAKKGKVKVPIHPICHKAIHACFTNSELSRIGEDRERLLQSKELARFVSWIADRPEDFDAPYR
jgi:hypothetical protein